MDQNPQAEITQHPSIDISGQASVEIGGDLVGRDKIVGYTSEQVSVLLQQIRSEYQPRPLDGRSPYVGLASFQEQDADRFFGREDLIAELVARVQHARAIFIAGPSGSGKSSLLRAGLIPALKKGQAPGSEHWLYETLKPGRAPLDELARVVSSLTSSLEAGDDLRGHALDDPARLHRWAEIALKDDPNRRMLLLVDQFEEIFTQLPRESEAERVAFLNLLTYAATVENGRVIALCTLRSDFVSNCAAYPEINSLLNREFLQVGAMTSDQLVSAIARPALQVGLRMDPALIAQIVNDVRGEPGVLPLMQFALQDLFEADKDKGELTLDEYLARGGLRHALERHADAEFAKLDEGERQLARSVFSGLIEIGRGGQDTKRTALFDELVPSGADASQVKRLVSELADARLVTTGEQGGQETVTLAHERLIDAWDWLHRLVNENREAIALQNELAQDAQEWEKQKRDESYLYRGVRLASAQEKLQQKQLVLGGLAQFFLEASIAARDAERAQRESQHQRELEQARALAVEQQQRAEAEESARREAEKVATVEKRRVRTFRLAALGLAGLLLVALFALGFAFQQQSQAVNEANRRGTAEANALRERDLANHSNAAAQTAVTERTTAEANALMDRDAAEQAKTTAQAAQVNALNEQARAEQQALISESRRLATQSTILRSQRFDLALLLAAEATRRDDNPQVRSNLLESLVHQPQLVTYLSIQKSGLPSPDGKILAVVNKNGSIELWDLRRQMLLGTLTGHGGIVSGMAFSPNGKLLASQDENARIFLWDLEMLQLQSELVGQDEFIESLAFSPDGTTLASAGVSGRVWLWNLATNQPMGVLETGQADLAYSIAFSPDSAMLVSGACGRDGWSECPKGEIQIWDVATRQPKGNPLVGHTEAVWSLAFSPNGEILASGGYDRTIRLWDLATRQPLGEPLIGHLAPVNGLTFSPDGKTIASIGGDARLWDITTKPPISQPLGGSEGQLRSLVFNPDGKTLVLEMFNGSILLWDSETNQSLGTPLIGHGGEVISVVPSPDGKTLASGGCGEIDSQGDCLTGEVILWSVATHQPLGRLLTDKALVRSLAFSPNGKTLAAGTDDGKVWLIDMMTRLPMLALVGHISPVKSVVFSPDGNLLASAGGDVRLWNVTTRQVLSDHLMSDGDRVRSLVFSPDGKTLVLGSDNGTISLWDSATHEFLEESLPNMTGSVFTIAYSPDSRILAVGGCESLDSSFQCLTGGIYLWDTVTHELLAGPLQGHTDWISSLAFSADGKMIASGSFDDTIRLWDAKTYEPLGAALKGHTGSVNGIAFDPENRWLVSASSDKTIRIWDVDPGSWKTRACSIANRNLAREEWERYVRSDSITYEDYAENPTCPGLPVDPQPTLAPIVKPQQ